MFISSGFRVVWACVCEFSVEPSRVSEGSGRGVGFRDCVCTRCRFQRSPKSFRIRSLLEHKGNSCCSLEQAQG